MVQLKLPCYRGAPVRTLETLAAALELSRPQLDALASNASRMYSYCPQKKKDGTPRDTWDAYAQLKQVHELLNRRFLSQVQYPRYLQGGIRDRAQPRDYVRHVGFHAGAQCVVALDIADFFPSITDGHVFDIWRRFFRFEEVVATVLTRLTTKDLMLPQGAKTSSYLANLVFWEGESSLVNRFESMGWTYSRLTDDICISKRAHPKHGEETFICRMAIGFVHAHKFSVKRRKLEVHRRNRKIELNSLSANDKPGLPKDERGRIRSQVQKLKYLIRNNEPVELKFVRSTVGKLAKLKRFHPADAERLAKTLPCQPASLEQFVKNRA